MSSQLRCFHITRTIVSVNVRTGWAEGRVKHGLVCLLVSYHKTKSNFCINYLPYFWENLLKEFVNQIPFILCVTLCMKSIFLKTSKFHLHVLHLCNKPFKSLNFFSTSEHHAIDLSEIDLPWNEGNIERYKDFAYTPREKPVIDSSLPVYIGIAKRFLQKGRGSRQVLSLRFNIFVLIG